MILRRYGRRVVVVVVQQRLVGQGEVEFLSWLWVGCHTANRSEVHQHSEQVAQA